MGSLRRPAITHETTCPNCGAVPPSASACARCGAVLVRPRAKPVLKDRDRALAATSRGGRPRGLNHWTVWLTFTLLLAPIGAIVWLNGSAPPRPDLAATTSETELGRGNPGQSRFKEADRSAYSQVRGEAERALRSGSTEDDPLASGLALPPRLDRGRDPVAATDSPTAGSSDSLADPSAAAVRPLAASPAEGKLAAEALGAAQAPQRRCSGIGEDAECLDNFDPSLLPPAVSSGQAGGAAAIPGQLETYRRKAAESKDILDKL